jgi:ABC-type dipeptide/oligopeptide/nickel transport system permease component
MSFDRATGDLWVGDVGWESFECVQRVVRGGNYGWSAMEGPQPVRADAERGPTPILPPLLALPRSVAASVIGGYVYRGSRLPELAGRYVFGMPTFLLGQLVLLLLFYRLTVAGFPIFPPSGYVPFSQNPGEWARHLVLPWFTLSLVTAATYARLTRGAMLDVLGEDYIRTARAKGISERRVTFRHALRAAIAPVVTQFGIDIGVLLGGAVVTEQVFGLPGLGREAVQAITTEDLPVIMGIVLLASAFVVLASIIVDVCYALIDPRVRVH